MRLLASEGKQAGADLRGMDVQQKRFEMKPFQTPFTNRRRNRIRTGPCLETHPVPYLSESVFPYYRQVQADRASSDSDAPCTMDAVHLFPLRARTISVPFYHPAGTNRPVLTLMLRLPDRLTR